MSHNSFSNTALSIKARAAVRVMAGIVRNSLTREPKPTNSIFRVGMLLLLLAGAVHAAWVASGPAFAKQRLGYALIWFALLVSHLAYGFDWSYRTRVRLRLATFAAGAALWVHAFHLITR